MQTLTVFVQEENGFTGAEKAILTLLGVGVVMVISKLVIASSQTGATNASTQITSQGRAANFEMK